LVLPTFPEPTVDPGRGRRLALLALLVAASSSWAAAPARSAAASAAPASMPVGASAPVAFAQRPSPLLEPAPDAGRVPALRMPVAGPVVRGFEARAGPYGPGHRGIDIAVPAGSNVGTPAAGRVVFVGPVAGSTWVSLLVAPGVVVTLGPLLDPAVANGRVLRANARVGQAAPGHGAGSPGHGAGAPAGGVASAQAATLHLSVRVDGVYVDPLAYLVDRPRPRLAPLLAPGGLPEG
jgi:murein DD-endopeptidase MepM/ murein hydrolase activator NlpD